MSVYIMSDLHGCLEEFEEMLKIIEFSEQDKLYIIGDVIDRGPSSIPLLKKIMGMENVVMMLGNHEYMMLCAVKTGDRAHWNSNGGETTFSQFSALPEAEQKEILKYLLRAPQHLDIEVEGKKFYLVHACPCLEDESNLRITLWDRPGLESVFFEDKTVIVGHTPTCYIRGEDNVMICRGKNTVYIDCGCFFSGVLGCLRLDDMEEFYVVPETCEVIEEWPDEEDEQE